MSDIQVTCEHERFEELLAILGFDDDEIYNDLWIIRDDNLTYKTIHDEYYCRMSVFYNKDGNNDYIGLCKKLLDTEFFSEYNQEMIRGFIDFFSNVAKV